MLLSDSMGSNAKTDRLHNRQYETSYCTCLYGSSVYQRWYTDQCTSHDLQAGLVQSWSGYAAYQKANTDRRPDLVQQWRDQLRHDLGAVGDDFVLTVRTKLCLMMARAC